MKEYAPACDRNSQVILDVLKQILPRTRSVLEIGSGTGQHAAYFASQLPHLHWLPTDRGSLDSKRLDLLSLPDFTGWADYDSIVCINTIHIMAWQGTEELFELAAQQLPENGVVYVYGPYRYADRPLESSNEDFDQWLKQRDPQSGVRDFEAVNRLASRAGFKLGNDIAMPANNRSIWWEKL